MDRLATCPWSIQIPLLNSTKQILSSLLETQTNEISFKSLGKVALAGTAIAALAKQLKLPPPSKFSKRQSALEFSKQLVKARDNKEALTAAVGLLNISARVLSSIPELRDLGHRIYKVVSSERLDDYIADE